MDVLPVTSDNKHLLAGLAEAISGWKGRGWLVDSGGYNPCRTQDNAALDQAIVHSADDLRNRRAFSHNLSDRTVVDGKNVSHDREYRREDRRSAKVRWHDGLALF